MKIRFRIILLLCVFIRIPNFGQCTYNASLSISGPTLGCGTRTLEVVPAGNVWTQKASFGGAARRYAVAFSIGGKGYMGSGEGSGYHNDFWEYNPLTDTWAQKANFGGPPRSAAVAFAIGSKGYLGTGLSGPTYRNDFWEYDPLTNVWTQKGNFGGSARQMAVGFCIGSKGYVGTGSSSSSATLGDFWEYDPVLDIWTQKANFVGTPRYLATGFSIGSKGYVGTGYVSTSLSKNDFWEYDPLTNLWTQKADIGNYPIYGSAGFSIGNYGYLAAGTEVGPTGISDKLWRYSPSSNTWIAAKSMGTANKRSSATVFCISGKAYIGTGTNSSYLNDFWQYEPEVSCLWSTSETRPSIVVSSSGTYSVLITAFNGCTASIIQTLALSPNPTLSISGQNFACSHISNTLVASGANTYSWSTNAGGANSYSVAVTSSATTIYTVSGTTGTCTIDHTFQVINTSPVLAMTVNGATLNCNTPTLSLSATISGSGWTAKAGINTAGRVGAVAFAIGTKGYLGTGHAVSPTTTFFTDLWEYDPVTGTWSQKADFDGGPRSSAVAFSIGTKGYICTGHDHTNAAKNDLWEYDPALNNWTQKNNFGGSARSGALAIVIGSKAYLGTGYNHTTSSKLNDFWEYNPISDAWVQKAAFAGAARTGAIGFGIGTKGYLGTGELPGNIRSNDFWEYDVVSNVWTQKTNYPGLPTYGGIGFSIGNKGYAGGGYYSSGVSSEFYKYDPVLNTWGPNIFMPTRSSTCSFVIGNKGYMGTGYVSASLPRPSDLWEYNSVGIASAAWSTGSAASAITVSNSGLYSYTVTDTEGCFTTLSRSVVISSYPNLSVTGSSVLCPGQSSSLSVSGANSYTWNGASSVSYGNSLVTTPFISEAYTITGTNGTCTTNYPITLLVGTIPPAASISVGNPTLACGIQTLNATIPGDSWVQKTGINSGRKFAVAFSIGNRGYMGTGYNNGTSTCYNDFWEYDPASNSWSQKANFGGGFRNGCVGFTIGSRGYVAVGASCSGTVNLSEFWEFNPGLNAWAKKSNFPGTVRHWATAFAIGNKGYLGMGRTASLSLINDFWEYDALSDTWTQRANFGGVARCNPASFSIGNKGYVGGGTNNGGTFYNDFWEYDPSTDTWVQRANYGGGAFSSMAGFSIGNKGYFCGGLNSGGGTNMLWQYDATGNTWIQKTNFPPGTRESGRVFVINGRAYFGIGATNASSSALFPNDLWQYDPDPTITWPNNSNLPAFTTPVSGIYSLVTTNAAGCSNTTAQSVILVNNPSLTITGATTICSGASSSLSVTGADTYTWSANGGGGNSNTNIVNPATSANYTLSATSGSCSTDFIIPVLVNPNPTVSVNSGAICAGNSFTINPVGAISYTFSGATNIVSPLVTTSYSIVGVDANGCVSQNPAVSQVTVNPVPIIVVNSGSICSGQSFTLNPGGASSYTYSGGSAVVMPSASISYSVTGTNSLGCISSSPAISDVTVYPTPTVSVNSGSLCAGEAFTIVPAGAINYTYTGGSAIITPASSGSYTVTGSNAFGCYNTNVAVSNVTVHALPAISAGGGSICAGNSFTISPTGAASYSYSGGSSIVTPATTTTYSVMGTSSLGCVSAGATILSVIVHTLPVISVNSGTICNGQSFTLSPGGASTYAYSGGSAIVSPTSNNSYSVTGTSGFGCISSSPAISYITVNPTPTVSVNSGSICAGQTFTIIPTGAINYSYSGGSSIIAPVSSGSYTVAGSNALGCYNTNVAVSNVTVHALPVISAGGGSICAGNSFTITPTGAVSYTYLNASQVVTPATTSIYSVTGTSSLGCVTAGSATLTVIVHTLPVISVNSGTICNGQSLTLSPGGANTYAYSGGSAIVSPTSNISYSVTGTSGFGCISSSPAISYITVNPTPTVSVNSGSICAGQTFTILPTGAINYTYSGGSAIVSPVSTASFAVTGFNLFGCPNSGTIVSTVTVHALPVVSASGGTICTGNSYTINPTGAASYTYSGGSAVVSPVTNTTYTVSGTSSVGCVGSISAIINITVNPLPVVSVAGGTICSGQNFTFMPSGATIYSYAPGGSGIVSPNVNTTYSIIGTSSLGCIGASAAVANVTVHALPTISVNSGTICSGRVFTIVPTGALNYIFSSGTATVSPLSNTSYSISGSDANGCLSANVAVATITVFSLPVISAPDATICIGDTYTIIPGGAVSYTYSSGSPVVSPVSSTNYSVTGTSGQGCLSASAATLNLMVNALPLITAPNGTICSGNSFTIVPTGANTYTYSSGSNIVAPTSFTSYTITGLSVQGCYNTAIVTVSVQPQLTLTINGQTLTCEGHTIALNATGANTYTWNNTSFVNPLITNPSVTTVYTVNALDGSCTGSAVTTVSVNPKPQLTVTNSHTEMCAGETATITVGGASSYTWSEGTIGTDIIITPAVANLYTYTVTAAGANGCLGTAIATQSVSDCVGLTEMNKTASINVFPNPNNGVLNIETVSLPENATVEVYNYIGQLIVAEKVTGDLMQLDYKDAAQGMCTLKVMANGKTLFVAKIIKQ